MALQPQVWAAGPKVSVFSEQSEDVRCLFSLSGLACPLGGSRVTASLLLMARGRAYVFLCFWGFLVSVSCGGSLV